MKDWNADPQEPDRELKEADILLEKADALLHKHKGRDSADQSLESWDSELPLLTDIVEDADLVVEEENAGGQTVELAESLIDLDTALTREIESWFASELPQLIARELDKLPGRLQQEALAHMRATLIPVLSEQLSSRLAKVKIVKR